ncbi:MAG TPA: tRNA dihydrouridine synthase DusB [Syntrophales bacterium]|nr:tRNA dihydrouridine synthase DusB [Syntrophales bacterium]
MKIGNLTLEGDVFLAPMAGITHPVFRWMVRDVGGAPGATEMVSAEGLVRDAERVRKYIRPFPGEKPFTVQLFGADPEAVAEAARMAVGHGADIIDLNAGCPVRKVVKAGAGAALMKEPGRLALILRRTRDAVPVPLTLKIRSGWHDITAPAVAKMAEDMGVDAVSVHARTAVQGFAGRADWTVIAGVKEAIRIPVIGNGDVRAAEDAVRMVGETGCDGVMIGRGSLGNPWLFRSVQDFLGGRACGVSPSLDERKRVICLHLERNVAFFGERDGVKDFYRHLAWYTKGMRDCASLRKQVLGLASHEAVKDAISRYFSSLQQT